MASTGISEASTGISAGWRGQVHDFVRALSGAYLFGIPLLYTMEMWWLGQYAGPGQLLLILGVTLLTNVAVVFAGGFRGDTSLGSKLEQAVEAVAVGAVGAILVLLVLNRVSFTDPPESILGMVIVQALPLSVGASLAGVIFGGKERQGGAQASGEGMALLQDIGATAIGAVFIASTISPTEEIPMLAARLEYWHLLALIGLSLGVGYAIVFTSGFDPNSGGTAQGPFQHPITETSVTYLVALLVALGALYVMQQIGAEDPPYVILQQTLVLGLPATVGGAAGRIAL